MTFTRVTRICRRLLIAGTVAACAAVSVNTQSTDAVQWPFYGGDQAGSKFSPLAELNAATVKALRPAWEWKPGEVPLEAYKTTPGAFEATPLMIDDTLYLSTSYNRVVALDAGTGREKWSFDPRAYEGGPLTSGIGFVHRGVAAWRDTRSASLRIFINSRTKLIQLDAVTGRPVDGFGKSGTIDLLKDLQWTVDPKHYHHTSPPIVFKDIVIVGSGIGDRLVYRRDPPGDVLAYHARTGERVWAFKTVPSAGEAGAETWEKDSNHYMGHTNVWAPMSLDDTRGLLYLPVSTASNDFYGGARPGMNLFSETLVCLDAATGQRKWHYQLVHHGLWDYDLPAQPNLVTITVDGRRIDAVAQVTKMGFVFVFDRVTGEPVWPIHERPVPASDVPGEQAWPTQPFPSLPPPLTPQGVSLEDAFDLTPELHARAQEEMRKYRLGPMYTPPSLEGTIMRPSATGGANWGGAAFDPETGVLYVKTTASATLARVARTTANDYVLDRSVSMSATFQGGLPIVKPPYAHLSAVDLNTGRIIWRSVLGDDVRIRNHPGLKGAALPEKLGVIAAGGGAIVTRGGLVLISGGDLALRVFDKATGAEVWTHPLQLRGISTPMAYRLSDGRPFVVIATGAGPGATLIALALDGV